MKMKVIRIEHEKLDGISKTGKPYSLDYTRVAVEVPFSSPKGFGTKEIEYQYGDHTNFGKIESLRDRLPLECELQLGQIVNDYGNPVTIITDIRVPASAPIKNP